jgi:GT2 family glycosyltransferase
MDLAGMSDLPSVAITIVTYNSESYIERCVESVLGQGYPKLEIIIVDNASTDTTLQLLPGLENVCRVIYNVENRGFAVAQNQAIACSSSEWILVLNPDVLMSPGFIKSLVAAGEADPNAGTVCGKLMAIGPSFQPLAEPVLDSTGIFFTPSLRHFDRGSRTLDDGRFDRLEYVFGSTGAAALYRRQMVDDVSIAGEFFDPDFFSYREDADVAWRAQLLGWKCLYTPDAVAYHVRRVLPENRRSTEPAINMHSVKNRWLLRLKNATWSLYRRHWLPITARDLAAILACFTVEVTSLPALWFLAKNWKATLAKRKAIMERRRVEDSYIAQWFSNTPVSFPAAGISEQIHARTRDLARGRTVS